MAEADSTLLHDDAPAYQLRELWQWPLLIVALTAFAASAWVFIDPAPAWGVGQKLALGRDLIDHGRHLDAIDQLNATLDTRDLAPDDQAAVHLLLAEALDEGQRAMGLDNPANHRRIVAQTREALALGAEPEAGALERMADSLRAVGEVDDAAEEYRRALVLDATRGPAVRKKLVEMLLADGQTGQARGEVQAYRQTPGISPSEQAWASGALADVLLDEGDVVGARAELERAKNLSPEPAVRGIVHLKLGDAAYKLGELRAAENELRVARDLLGPGHDLDADACLLLGKIALERNDFAEAASFFDVIIEDHPNRPIAADASLHKAAADAALGHDEQAVEGFARAAAHLQARPTLTALANTARHLVADAHAQIAARGDTDAAVELLAVEHDLHNLSGEPPAAYFARLARTLADHADAADRRAAEAGDSAQGVEAKALARRARESAGDALLTYARRLSVADDAVAQEAVREGIDLYERAGALEDAAAALQLFALQRPKDPTTPDALRRLGDVYGELGRWEDAADAYRRNRELYPRTLAAAQSAVPLAKAPGPPRGRRATTRRKPCWPRCLQTTRCSRPTPRPTARRSTSWPGCSTPAATSRPPSPGSTSSSPATPTTPAAPG